jgi:pyridoxine 5'-phosphate synthase PdxJ
MQARSDLARRPINSTCVLSWKACADQRFDRNIGHDLNLVNLPPLLRRLPMVAEASIGHELTADGLVMGFGAAVAAYKRIMKGQDHQQA